MKVQCPLCGKIIGGYVPRGGDVARIRPRKHRESYRGPDCKGRFCILDVAKVVVVQVGDTVMTPRGRERRQLVGSGVVKSLSLCGRYARVQKMYGTFRLLPNFYEVDTLDVIARPFS